MHQLFVIYKDYEGRRLNRRLGNIIYFQPLSFICGWLLHCNCFRYDLIEHACSNTKTVVLDNNINHFKQLREALPGFCGNEQNLCIGHKAQDLANLICILLYRIIVLLNGVPLIDSDNNSFSPVMGDSGNLCILFRNTLCGINNNNDNVRTLYCRYGTNNTVPLDFFLNLILSPKSRCINKGIFFSVKLDLGIDCIPGGSCDIRYNDPVLLRKLVDQ